MPLTLFYGDKSGSMNGKHVELASTAFMELVNKARLVDAELQLALINVELEKLPVGRYSFKDLTKFVQEWQHKCSNRTKLWQNIWQDLQKLDKDAVKDAHVIVITDGMDNTSDGKFKGPQGAHHLVDMLKSMQIGHINFNIVGVGDLDAEVSSVFENISSLSGGLHHNIKNLSDLPAFSQRFVKPFVDVLQNPTIGSLRCRERQSAAKLSVGIWDDQVQDAIRASSALRAETEDLKQQLGNMTAENSSMKNELGALKEDNAQLKNDLADLKTDYNTTKAYIEEFMRFLKSHLK